MSNIKWNSFKEKYKDAVGLISTVSSTLPKKLAFDIDGKRLPTPYSLFKQWAKKKLKNDWSSIKVQGGFIICISDKSDENIINMNFDIFQKTVETTACKKTKQMDYNDSHYGKLAKQLGYNINTLAKK